MGRHTGFCLLRLLALLLSLRVAGSSVDSVAVHQQANRPETILSAGARSYPGSAAKSNSVRSHAPRFLLIGSLDLSGTPHSVTLHVSDPEARPCPDEWTTERSGFLKYRQHVNLTSPVQSSVARPASVAIAAMSDRNHENHAPADSQSLSGPAELATSLESVQTNGLSEQVTRRFLVPQFHHNDTRDVLIEAKLILQTTELQVYFGDSGHERSGQIADPRRIGRLADLVCRLAQIDALPLVHEWIGPVTDLDQDDRLTFLLTFLDLRPVDSGIPVFGCVRPADYALTEARDFGGDIVYLDLRAPVEELPGLLVHELTHAAILSHHPPDHADAEMVPGWLNEAAAHVMERQVQPNSPGFECRLADFRRTPWRCPIVANEDFLTPLERRLGTRAAGALFLSQLVSNPMEMRAVLATASHPRQWISRISGRSTDDVLMEWWTCQAAHCNPHDSSGTLSPRNPQVTVSLYGTSFVLIPIDPSVSSLAIESDAAAQIQCRLLDLMEPALSVARSSRVRNEGTVGQ